MRSAALQAISAPPAPGRGWGAVPAPGGAVLGCVLGCVLVAALVAPTPAQAEADPRRIQSAETFTGLVEGRALTRFGVTLQVDPGGRISGRALGRPVEGRWEWRDGYFCRDFMGKGLLGYDCQTVEVQDDTLRFRAQRGTGDTLDLRLR